MVSHDQIKRLFESAMTLHQQGLVREALPIYQQLAALSPESGTFLGLIGTVLHQRGDPAQAVGWLQRALAVDPFHGGNLINRAQVAVQIGQWDQAFDSYRLAYLLNPGCGQTLWNLALSFSVLNQRSTTPNMLLLRALKESRDPASEAISMGDRLIALGCWRDAASLFQWAMSLNPSLSDPYFKWGYLRQEGGQCDLALTHFDRAIQLSGRSGVVESMRAYCLRELRRFDEALLSYDDAIRGGVSSPEIRVNRGMTLMALNRFEEALGSHERAAVEKPELFEIYMNRGNTLQKLGRHQEALRDYGRALQLNPEVTDLHLNRGCLKLLLGDFESGWTGFESRFETDFMRGTLRAPDHRLLLNDVIALDLTGKTLLVYPEQGLGDFLQFCRFVPFLVDRGATVYLETPQPLMELMGSLDPRVHVMGPGALNLAFDLKIPVMSLARLFVKEPQDLLFDFPYLRPNPEKVAYWAKKIPGSTRKRVGLVWSGGLITQAPDIMAVQELRNIPLRYFEGFRDVDADFFSLQKGDNGESQLAQLEEASWEGPQIINYSSELKSFADTAALIENLDLVIAVDTSTAHLAGAMGKPVWILNRYDTCWRWFLSIDHSPWYPSARIFRQDASRRWEPVVQQVLNTLKAGCASEKPQAPSSLQ